MKNILYFFPLNLMSKNAGSIHRAWTLVNFFKTRGFCVDYVYSNDFFGGGPIGDAEIKELKSLTSIQNIFKLSKRPRSKLSFDYLFNYKFHKIYNSLFKRKRLPSFVTPYSQMIFDKILRDNSYDYIIISYVYWADLIKNNPLIKDAKVIIDTHDFLSSQEQHNIDIGKAFKDEINRLNLFDEIWTVSTDEKYLFGQFCTKPIKLIPITFRSQAEISAVEKAFDLIYIAGDNPHNRKAAGWFFSEVYPKLQRHVTICVVGKIVDWIPEDINIKKVKFTDELEKYYKTSLVAICPMLSGTGVKVKILEALSFGLPVVCSPAGVDGLVNKLDNGCLVSDTPNEFVDNISKLLGSLDEYKKAQRQGVDFFERNYTEHILFALLDETFIVHENNM